MHSWTQKVILQFQSQEALYSYSKSNIRVEIAHTECYILFRISFALLSPVSCCSKLLVAYSSIEGYRLSLGGFH